jgi:hypothetical protein
MSQTPRRKKEAKARAFLPTFNRAATITHNKSAKRYDYGKDNLLPNQLLNAINASVTASSCRARKSEFIEGNGIKDRSIASLIINPNQTADDLVMELSDIVGLFGGLAINVKYNAIGEPYYLYTLPFECVRKTDDGQYYVNEKLSVGKDAKSDRVYYDDFDRFETPSSRLRRVSNQIEEYGYQTGDILYLYGKKAGQAEYPIPTAWAGMEEIEADAALGRLDWRNVKKGFRPDAILTTVGTLDDVNEDENGRTEQYYFDKNIEAFTGEDSAPVLHIQVDNVDQAPKLETFSQEKLLNSTTEAADRIGKRVCRAMEVPDVLIPGFGREGQLGNNQEMMNLMKMYNKTVERSQRLISRALEKVFPQLDWTIEPIVLIEELPQWLLDVLTPDEKRSIGGYAVNTVAESGGVSDALSVLSPLVATKVLEEMSSEEIRALINLLGSKPTEETEAA